MSSANQSSVVTENSDGSVNVVDESPDQSLSQEAEGGASEGGASENEADASLRTSDNDDEDDQNQANDPDAAGISDDERAKRERRRAERQAKKQRVRDRDANFRLELAARDRLIDDMRQQLDVVNRRSTGADLASLDARIRREEENVTYLKNVIADGTTSQNGAAVAEATLQMSQKLADLQHLGRIKQQMTRQANAPAQPQLDPRMVVNAAAWMRDNSWYNPANPDADSRQVLVIDQKLAEENYNPNSPEYWEELTRRVAATLPHRRGGRQTAARDADNGYNAGANPRKPSRSVVTGSGSDGAATQGRSARTYTLSAERVQALKDAGMWDDPKARNSAIARFKEYDAQSSTR